MNLLKICLISSIASASVLPYRLCAETKTFKVNKRYLNIPVSHSQDRHKMTFMTEKGETLTVAVRLAKEKEDYWVFRDLSNMKGKQLTVSYELDGLDGFQNMYMANEIEGQGTGDGVDFV